MKTITIRIGRENHRLVIDKEPQMARVCISVCSLRGVCRRLDPQGGMLCDELLTEISDSPKYDFPFGGHFELKNKQ